MSDLKLIRNFSIIAHIDHGKITLADRLLASTDTVTSATSPMTSSSTPWSWSGAGITIKAHPVRMIYRAKDGAGIQLNLIDTPGHVDFSYEVSRSLAACEGAILVVDASSGRAGPDRGQRLHGPGHTSAIAPVINKVDLPTAGRRPAPAARLRSHRPPERRGLLPAPRKASASPKSSRPLSARSLRGGPVRSPREALIFDSRYDSYRGVVTLSRVFEGQFNPSTRPSLFSNSNEYEVQGGGRSLLPSQCRPRRPDHQARSASWSPM